VAGVLLLRRNVASPEQILQLSMAFREASANSTPVIAIDQEGGRVARLDNSNGFRDWISAAAIAASKMSDGEIFEYYLTRAREMSSVGINLNMGPVLDLNLVPFNPIIGALDRSFGRKTSAVIRCATAFTLAHRAAGVKTCAKHFPGHGSAITDSHLEATDVSNTWSSVELEPFQEMILENNVDSIMSSHVIHRRFSDSDTTPVSLSVKGIAEIRGTLGYQGPVFTDDMQMGAITGQYAQGEAAVAAVNAGNTFLLYSNYRKWHRIETAAEVVASLSLAREVGSLDMPKVDEQLAYALAFRGGLF
jgi:beta-N-acetylhexosaminidase